MKIQLLIITTLINLLVSKRLQPERVRYAVNCGSTTALKSSDGFTYEADENPPKNTEIALWAEDISVSKERIKYTEEANLYLTERWSWNDFTYDIPLEEDGEYVLITQHSEVI